MKKQIIATAKNMIDYKDDCDFENKLKAIADMKREIFSIELECASDIRKENGKIKWKIREEKSNRDNLLKFLFKMNCTPNPGQQEEGYISLHRFLFVL